MGAALCLRDEEALRGRRKGHTAAVCPQPHWEYVLPNTLFPKLSLVCPAKMFLRHSGGLWGSQHSTQEHSYLSSHWLRAASPPSLRSLISVSLPWLHGFVADHISCPSGWHLLSPLIVSAELVSRTGLCGLSTVHLLFVGVGRCP